MIDNTVIFGVTAGLLNAGASFFYVRDIYQGRNHPQRAGFLIFFTLNLIFITSQFAEGARLSILALTAWTIGQILVLPKLRSAGVGGFETKDRISISVAGVGLVLWAITSEPLTALIASLIVDIPAVFLTLEKTYRLPWSETLIAWISGIITSFLSLLAVGSLQFELLIIPTYLTVVTVTATTLIVTRRRKIPNPEIGNWPLGHP